MFETATKIFFEKYKNFAKSKQNKFIHQTTTDYFNMEYGFKINWRDLKLEIHNEEKFTIFKLTYGSA